MADANIRAVITAKDEASQVLKGVGQAAAGIGTAVKEAAVLSAVGLTAITAGAIHAVKAFNESEEAIAQTNAVLASTKGVAGITAGAVTDLAKSLQKTTTFSDESVRSVENLLLTFTSIGKDIMPQATGTVLDMATALGEDTKSASVQLGKALQDPINGITALRRVGVNFSDAQKTVIENLVKTGKTAEAQKLILKELNTEFGGSAAAAAKTFSGQMKQLGNQLNDVEESVGKFIVEAITPLVSWAAKAAAAIDWDKVLANLKVKLDEARDKFVKFTEPIRDFISKHKDELIYFFTRFAEVAVAVIPTLTVLGAAFAIVSSPLFLIVAALTAGWFLWEKHRVMFEALAIVLAPLVAWLILLKAAMIIDSVISAATTALAIFSGTAVATTGSVGTLTGAIVAMGLAAAAPLVLVVVGVAAILAAYDAVQNLTKAWNDASAAEARANSSYDKMVKDARSQYAAGKITKERLNALTSGGGSTFGGSAPTYASGTDFHPGGMAIVGEQGPELLNLPRGSSVTPNNKISTNSTVNVTLSGVFTGNPADMRRLAEQVFKAAADSAGAKNMTLGEMY